MKLPIKNLTHCLTGIAVFALATFVVWAIITGRPEKPSAIHSRLSTDLQPEISALSAVPILSLKELEEFKKSGKLPRGRYW